MAAGEDVLYCCHCIQHACTWRERVVQKMQHADEVWPTEVQQSSVQQPHLLLHYHCHLLMHSCCLTLLPVTAAARCLLRSPPWG
jgi:hypothetical protein